MKIEKIGGRLKEKIKLHIKYKRKTGTSLNNSITYQILTATSPNMSDRTKYQILQNIPIDLGLKTWQ